MSANRSPLLLAISAFLISACTIQGPRATDDDDDGGGAPTAGAGGAPIQQGQGGTGAPDLAGAGGVLSTGGNGGDPSVGGEAGGGGQGAGAPVDPSLDAEEASFLQIINDYREQNSLGPLTTCASLNEAAQAHSEDMRDDNYFSHDGLNGSTPPQRACQAGYQHGCGPTTYLSENIAAGNSTANATFAQWQNSPGHNANMLSSVMTQIGIGRATGGGMYGTYWTTVFAGSDEPSCE